MCAHRGVLRCVLTGCALRCVLRCRRKGLKGFANKRALLVCKQNRWSETSWGRAQGLCLDQGAVTSWRPCWSRLTVKVILQAGCRALHRRSPGGAQVGAEHERRPLGGRGASRTQQGAPEQSAGSGPTWWRRGTGGVPRRACTPPIPLFPGQAPCLQSGRRHSDPSQPEVSPVRGLAVGQASLVPRPASTSLQQTQGPPPVPTDHPLAEMGPHLDPFYITTGPDLLRSLHALLPTQVRDPQPCDTHPHCNEGPPTLQHPPTPE